LSSSILVDLTNPTCSLAKRLPLASLQDGKRAQEAG
jgi:hypothetical protein